MQVSIHQLIEHLDVFQRLRNKLFRVDRFASQRFLYDKAVGYQQHQLSEKLRRKEVRSLTDFFADDGFELSVQTYKLLPEILIAQ